MNPQPGSFNWYLKRSGSYVHTIAIAICQADPPNVEGLRTLYPQMVAANKLTQEKADYETECMVAIVASLRKLVMLAEVSEEMKENDRKRRN